MVKSMTKLKAIWSKEEFDKLTPDQKEVMASKIILFSGLILFLGGLLFLWKIGFWDFNDFWGIDRSKMTYFRYRRTVIDCATYSVILCFPAIAGAWLIFFALIRLRHKKDDSSKKKP